MSKFLIMVSGIVLSLFFISYSIHHNLAFAETENLKFVAQEAAAAGAQYFLSDAYSQGFYVFNRTESLKAIDYVIKQNMKLNSDLTPKDGSYWTDTINYQVFFFDDNNSNFSGEQYVSPSGKLTMDITAPTIVVSINAGKAKYPGFVNDPPIIWRDGAYTLQGY